jgi:uncharacterized membrane protein YfcA
MEILLQYTSFIDTIVIVIVTFVTSLITFFSGFGLGSVLMPVLGITVPIHIAIGITAIVHLVVSAFKSVMLFKDINWKTTIQFGISAAIFSIGGALLLKQIVEIPFLPSYDLMGITAKPSILKIVVGCFLLGIIIYDIIPSLKKRKFNKKYLYVGGAIAGFFGGLTGLQGAMRSAFLMGTELEPEEYIATSSSCSTIIDAARVAIYIPTMLIDTWSNVHTSITAVAATVAVVGTIIGFSFLKFVTIKTIRIIVVSLIGVLAISTILGIL